MKKYRLLVMAAFVAVILVCGIALAEVTKCNDFTFDATKSRSYSSKLSYHWDFGDGNSSDDPVVTHRYEKAGDYTVKLTVKDESGLPCDSSGVSQPVKVNTPPFAQFDGPDAVCAGSEITYSASASRSDTSKNLTYNWDFGDGTTAQGVTVKKTFEKGGWHRVRLLIDDNLGTECSGGCAEMNVKVNSQPTANAGGKDIVMTCMKSDDPYRVTFSGSGHDPDGDKLKYAWNFGDGASAEGARVTHDYEKGGTYKATLTVDDGSGTSCSFACDSINVTLSKAPKAIAEKSGDACVGNEVMFNGSSSYPGDGSSPAYNWDFGDGTTAKGAKVSHAYTKGGKYCARLTVTNGDCSSVDTACVDINMSPVASVTSSGDTCVGKSVIFDASGTTGSRGLKYTWDFGDGTTITGGAKESHSYEKGGTYTAKVTVDDGKGTPCSTGSVTTSVTINSQPIALIAPNNACCVGVDTMFDGSGSSGSGALKYSWDFGDGTTAMGAKANHTYVKPGNYKVVLTVDDGKGTPCSTSYATTEARIHEGPEAVMVVR